MKFLITSILVLATSLTQFLSACGYYTPYGDAIRFNFLTPECFDFDDYGLFHYSASWYNEKFSIDPQDNVLKIEASKLQNVNLWRQRCEDKINIEDVYLGVYAYEKQKYLSNSFIEYLKKNDPQALEYLEFAQACSILNSDLSDPWERSDDIIGPKRAQQIKFALQKAGQLGDEMLQKRYAFIAIRLAYYNGDFQGIEDIYNKYFDIEKSAHIIDYWALYFKVMISKSSSEVNYWGSLVFTHAPDKRFQIDQVFRHKIPVEEVLTHAKNDIEKANIIGMYTVKNPGRALADLKKIQQLAPSSRIFTFLMLREVNKIEDWVLTPYFSNLNPSIQVWDDKTYSYYPLTDNIESDKAYSKKLLQFIGSIDKSKVQNKLIWQAYSAHLNFINLEHQTCLDQIKLLLEEKEISPLLALQLKKLRVLSLTALQTSGKTKLLPEAKQLLSQKYNDTESKFIVALASVLEHKGNTTDAAILYSCLNRNLNIDWDDQATWSTKKEKKGYYHETFFDYFYYLDYDYTPKEIAHLISHIEKTNPKDEFEKWYYEKVKKDISHLYDLLGTKHIRHDELDAALAAFKKVNDTLWTSDVLPYKQYLDANPFYGDFNNGHEKTKADTITYTKVGITERLISHIKKGNDNARKDRDYHYFMAANCYFNMTTYGNSWLMKRYSWSHALYKDAYIDNKDYHECIRAQDYYLKASKVSKTTKFAALSLTMAGKCRKFANYSKNVLKDYNEPYVNFGNPFMQQLEKEYPDDYDMLSSCGFFNTYFTSREKQE